MQPFLLETTSALPFEDFDYGQWRLLVRTTTTIGNETQERQQHPTQQATTQLGTMTKKTIKNLDCYFQPCLLPSLIHPQFLYYTYIQGTVGPSPLADDDVSAIYPPQQITIVDGASFFDNN